MTPPRDHRHESPSSERTPLLSHDGTTEHFDRQHRPSKASFLQRTMDILLTPFRVIMRSLNLSKANRMWILVFVDVVFLLIELGSGYYVGSLALIADAFHMLNDVISLAVGLWAVKIAARPAQGNYTYGWQRAEILGAFFNGVFLVALCVTIFLEAIQRLVEPPVIDKPDLIGWVGFAGLCSNLFGLLLFFDHGHSHGHDHDHDHEHSHGAEEEHTHTHAAGSGHAHGTSTESAVEEGRAGATVGKSPSKDTGALHSPSPSQARARRVSIKDGRRENSLEESIGHPSSMRQEWMSNNTTHYEDAIAEEPESQDAQSATKTGNSEVRGREALDKSIHDEHHHRQAKKNTGHGGSLGHNHGDLGMQGIFLHVLGDCLGNIGVILTALFIKFTDFSWKFYADPLISIVITAIILKSAIPLCLAASRILLQATPPNVDIKEIENDINDMLDSDRERGQPPRALAHHLHVWQLTDTKLVASVHVRVKGKDGTSRYMALAKSIHTCLHEYGIDSSTIQPEFDDDDAATIQASTTSTIAGAEQCLMECDSECTKDGGVGSCCQPTTSRDPSPGHSDSAGHDHNH